MNKKSAYIINPSMTVSMAARGYMRSRLHIASLSRREGGSDGDHK